MKFWKAALAALLFTLCLCGCQSSGKIDVSKLQLAPRQPENGLNLGFTLEELEKNTGIKMESLRDGVYYGLGSGDQLLLSAMTDDSGMVMIINASFYEDQDNSEKKREYFNRLFNDGILKMIRPEGQDEMTEDTPVIGFTEDDTENKEVIIQADRYSGVDLFKRTSFIDHNDFIYTWTEMLYPTTNTYSSRYKFGSDESEKGEELAGMIQDAEIFTPQSVIAAME